MGVKGYRPRPFKILDLEFTDPELKGLEVQCKSVSVKEQIALETNSFDNEELLTLLADRLVSWNVLDDDETVMPTTRESLEDLGIDFVSDIVVAWRYAIVGIKRDLGKDSQSGDTLMEESLSMDAL